MVSMAHTGHSGHTPSPLFLTMLSRLLIHIVQRPAPTCRFGWRGAWFACSLSCADAHAARGEVVGADPQGSLKPACQKRALVLVPSPFRGRTREPRHEARSKQVRAEGLRPGGSARSGSGPEAGVRGGGGHSSDNIPGQTSSMPTPFHTLREVYPCISENYLTIVR
jgi:hypothetical protein